MASGLEKSANLRDKKGGSALSMNLLGVGRVGAKDGRERSRPGSPAAEG